MAGPVRSLTRIAGGTRRYLPAVSRQLPERKFVLYTRGRSGSELLLDLLRHHSDVACDGEILGAPVRSPWLWVRAHAARAARSGAGTYGFKVLYNDLTGPQQMSDPAGFLRRLHDDGYKIVTLERRNLLRHAVSWLQSREQQTHYRSEAERASYRPVAIEPEAAIAVMYIGEQDAQQQEATVTDLPHLALTYEESLEDPSTHQATVDQVFAFLGLSSEPVKTTLVRSSPRRLSDSLENYADIAALVGQTRFAKYLDHDPEHRGSS